MAIGITKNEGTEVQEIDPPETTYVANDFYVRFPQKQFIRLIPSVILTQDEYDALEEKNSKVLYLII